MDELPADDGHFDVSVRTNVLVRMPNGSTWHLTPEQARELWAELGHALQDVE